jgi:thioredoxin 1
MPELSDASPLARKPRLKERLMSVFEVNDGNWESDVIESSKTKPVVVDFWAPWCGPCRMVSPVLEELSEEMTEQLTFCKINIDENQETANKFGVMSIPTMIIFKNGEVIDRTIGASTKNKLKEKFEAHL